MQLQARARRVWVCVPRASTHFRFLGDEKWILGAGCGRGIGLIFRGLETGEVILEKAFLVGSNLLCVCVCVWGVCVCVLLAWLVGEKLT